MTVRRYQILVLVMILAGVLALDCVFIPLHAGDDEEHFAIAYSAAHLHLGLTPPPSASLSSGSYVDRSIQTVIARNFDAVRLNARPRPGRTAWSGQQVYRPLPGAAYARIIYLPQVAAIWLGESVGASVETTINLARVFNAVAALTIIAAALAYLPEMFGVFVLVLLSLPKSLQLLASNSVDLMDHAITISILAFTWRGMTGDREPKAWHYFAASIGVFTVAGVRPPLAALGLLILYLAYRHRSIPGSIAAVLGMAASVSWWAYVLPLLRDTRCPASALSFGQKAYAIVGHWPSMMAATLAHRGVYYWATFIGELGYGDARIGSLRPLPLWVYASATAMLLLASASLGSDEAVGAKPARTPLALTALIIVAGIFLSLAVDCTAMGQPIIEGVQGRYFVTPLLLLAMVAVTLLKPLELASKVTKVGLPIFLLGNVAIMIREGLELYWSV